MDASSDAKSVGTQQQPVVRLLPDARHMMRCANQSSHTAHAMRARMHSLTPSRIASSLQPPSSTLASTRPSTRVWCTKRTGVVYDTDLVRVLLASVQKEPLEPRLNNFHINCPTKTSGGSRLTAKAAKHQRLGAQIQVRIRQCQWSRGHAIWRSVHVSIAVRGHTRIVMGAAFLQRKLPRAPKGAL